jgi:hypothetical protein
MVQLNRTAAYVRKGATGHQPSAAVNNPYGPVEASSTLERKIWALLLTPHTVDSLTKAIASEAGTDTAGTQQRVAAVLQQWLDKELIELSADS